MLANWLNKKNKMVAVNKENINERTLLGDHSTTELKQRIHSAERWTGI